MLTVPLATRSVENQNVFYQTKTNFIQISKLISKLDCYSDPLRLISLQIFRLFWLIWVDSKIELIKLLYSKQSPRQVSEFESRQKSTLLLVKIVVDVKNENTKCCLGLAHLYKNYWPMLTSHLRSVTRLDDLLHFGQLF